MLFGRTQDFHTFMWLIPHQNRPFDLIIKLRITFVIITGRNYFALFVVKYLGETELHPPELYLVVVYMLLRVSDFLDCLLQSLATLSCYRGDTLIIVLILVSALMITDSKRFAIFNVFDKVILNITESSMSLSRADWY